MLYRAAYGRMIRVMVGGGMKGGGGGGGIDVCSYLI